MADGYCDLCGQPVDFREIDGIRRPIHLDGPCPNAESRFNRSDGARCGGVKQWWDDGFCRATSCPKCGDDVFFVRHNGGSVWFDELGWPWPKHGCFADSACHASIDWALENVHCEATGGGFGIVVKRLVFADRSFRARVVAIALSNQTGICVRVQSDAPIECGDVVTIADRTTTAMILTSEFGTKHKARVIGPGAIDLNARFIDTGRIGDLRGRKKPPRRARLTAEKSRRVVEGKPANELTPCPVCGAKVRESRLAKHRLKVHEVVLAEREGRRFIR